MAAQCFRYRTAYLAGTGRHRHVAVASWQHLSPHFEHGPPAFPRFRFVLLLPATRANGILSRLLLDKPVGVALCAPAQHPHRRERHCVCTGVLPYLLWNLLSRLPFADHHGGRLPAVRWGVLRHPSRRPARVVGISLRWSLGWYRISDYLVTQKLNGITWMQERF